jgi:Mg2+ and Co2+ transporter CorA
VPFRSVGSLWGKWDLHFYSQSSYDYQNKSLIDEQLVGGLIAAGIVAVAVTDHHVIDVKRIKSMQSLGGAKLTVFPGIELRSELGGSESVHLIGIFSETADPDYIWTKIQGPLGLTAPDIARMGGDDRVYVRFEQAAKLIHDLGGRVSVHVGRKSNSIENIGNNHPYKQAFKEDLARTHIDLFELGRVTDEKAYKEKVFPTIGYEKPLIICSDNHDIRDYRLKAPCWIKADPAFAAFQQIVSDPQERVFIGEVPPAVDRVRKNPTKYLKSISFSKISGSTLNEDWFAGTIALNPGFIAIVGNKGTGKTALAEAIGLLGNTAQSAGFCFLHPNKFRQPRNNKAKHFVAVVEWEDGRRVTKSLADEVDSEEVEVVSYIPQNYLETICNEIQSADSRFDKELKSVIFSHVADANRLGVDTLDELLDYQTEQTYSRMEQLRHELNAINERIVHLQEQSSKEAGQLLLNLYGAKKHHCCPNSRANC